jgi:DNA-directed RNA polymerase subunit RPC12/RpoP
MTSLLNTNPDLAKEWHPTKNAPLTPKDVAPNSNKKAWWVCGRGHEWEAMVSNRNQGAGCPYCSGRLATKEKNLRAINPSLAKEWHPTKNAPLTPKDVTPNSHKKVWWVCGKGHEWEAAVNNRNRGTGCRYCSGRMVCIDNCLDTINPDLAKEWHPTKNAPLTPKDVTSNSSKKVWWVCSKDHEWEATVNNRNQGKGCRYCSGRRK